METKTIVFALFASVALVGCNNAPQGEKAQTGEAIEATSENGANATVYQVDPVTSVIHWEGARLVGDKHVGTIRLSEGKLEVSNGQLVGGTFALDMNSISDDDLEGAKKAKLETHLKSGDFFEVETYPVGTFELVSAEPVADNPEATHNLTGNLTLKGITKSITFPAKVNITEESLEATTPAFVIDRTQWNVMFQAGLLGTAKDKIIKDEIALRIDLKAPQTSGIQ